MIQVLHPVEHSELHNRLKESQDRGAIESALNTLDKALQNTDLEGVDLSGRPKNLYGVMKKMHAKNKAVDQVYDVRALRVIVQSKNDCYAVLREVSSLLLPSISLFSPLPLFDLLAVLYLARDSQENV